MVRKQPNRLAWIAVGSLFVLVGACSIVAEVDREEIPEGSSTGGTGGAGGTGGTGGTGATGGTGGTGGGGGCTSPSDCPGTDGDCQARTCTDSTCGVSFTTAGTATVSQVDGDCKKLVCDGSGSVIAVNDNADLPTDDNDCTTGTCVNGSPNTSFVAEGTSCATGGGSVCDGAGACVECLGPSDCPTTGDLCVGNECVPVTCGNSQLDTGETDVDCGGPDCSPCADTLKCLENDDCQSGVCDATAKTCTAPACDDEVENGSETDVDCGGSCPNGCAEGKACTEDGDCKGGDCDGTVCLATCTDEERNGTETDVDCGGSCTTKCAVGKACAGDGDCASDNCVSNVCEPVDACANQVKDGDETDVDCGGPDCDPCGDGDECEIDTDCVNFCAETSNLCVASHCDDEKKSGDETDVDCGGSCPGCAAGDVCADDGDCTGFCAATALVCVTSHCADEKQDEGETGVDCGGTCPLLCIGDACTEGNQCKSGKCDEGGTNLCIP